MQIPGVDWVVAAVLIAEIGVDMSVFVSVYHLSAWAGVRPGNHESAGRQKSGRARKGNIHLRTILVSAAISASRTKGSYLKDKFHRLKARRGDLRAALAIAQKILVCAYHMLAQNLPYRDLGEAYLDQIGQTRTVANLKRRLERLGYNVTLEPRPSLHDTTPTLKLFSWQGFRRQGDFGHSQPFRFDRTARRRQVAAAHPRLGSDARKHPRRPRSRAPLRSSRRRSARQDARGADRALARRPHRRVIARDGTEIEAREKPVKGSDDKKHDPPLDGAQPNKDIEAPDAPEL